jgi:fibronectin type 3 domain-containing protein
VPATPANFIASGPITNNGINFSWSASTGAARYELYETTSGSPMLIFSGTATSFSTTRAEGNMYFFYVQACSAGGCSPPSSTRTVTIDCKPVSCL